MNQLIALLTEPNVQVSDTTGDDQCTAAGYHKNITTCTDNILTTG